MHIYDSVITLHKRDGTTFDLGESLAVSGGLTPLTTTASISGDLNTRLTTVENNYATKASPVSGAYNSVVVNSQGVVTSGGNFSYALTSSIPTSATFLADYDDRYVNTTGNETISGIKTFQNDVVVSGNLYVNGTEFIVSTESVSASDNQIVINAGEVGPGVTAGIAGIRVDRGSLSPYDFQFRESDDSFVIGISGDYQAVATREDTPINTAFGLWNSTAKRFDTSNLYTISTFIGRSEVAGISGDLQGQINSITIPTSATFLADYDARYVNESDFTVTLANYTLLSTTASISGGLDTRLTTVENNYATKATPVSGAYNNVIVNSQGIVTSGGNFSYAIGEVESFDVGTLGYTSNAAAFGSITTTTTISGGSSGATAQLRSVGTTSSGTMTLVSIVGNFQVGESVVLSSAPTKPITVTSFDKKLNTLQVVRNSTNNRDVTLYSAPTGLVNWISSQSSTPNMVFWLGQNSDAHFLSRGFNSDIVIEKDFVNSINTTNQVRLGWEGASALLSVGGSQVFGIAGTGIVTHSRQSQFENTIDQRASSTTVSSRAVFRATGVNVNGLYDPLAYGTNRGTLKYLLQLDDGTNVRSSEIIATYNGATVNWNEFAINEVGSVITGASWSVATSGANLGLVLSVTSGTYNVRISRESLI